MKRESPWVVLGIPASAEEADIRRAYAELLKRTNPEDDAEGFKRLRGAYELALQHASWRSESLSTHDAEKIDHALDSEVRGEAELAQFRPNRLTYRTLPSRPTPQEFRETRDDAERDSVLALQAHIDRRNALADALATEAHRATLLSLLRDLLHSPGMSRVDTFAETAVWLVDIVHRTSPTSNPLVEPIIEFFDWKATPEQINEWRGPQSMLALRDRIRAEIQAFAFIDRVSDRRHEFYRAYAVTRPDANAIQRRPLIARLWMLRHLNLVTRFLSYIEAHYSTAKNALDKTKVEWWRDRQRRETLAYMLIRNAHMIILSLCFALAMFAGVSQ